MEENVIIDFLRCHDLRPLIDNVEPREEHHYVAGLKQEIESNGTQALFTRYSPIVKMLERCSQTKAVVTTTILDILDLGWSRLVKVFQQIDGKYKDVDVEDLVEYRKTLAMLFFLTYRAVMEIENYRYGEVQQKYLRTMTEKRRGQSTTGHFPYWPDYRLKLLKSCLAVLRCDLNAFWGNHEVETGSGFLRCVLLFSMLILRQSSKDLTRDPSLADVMNDILGLLATKYGEEESILSRLAPIIKEGEEAAKAVTGVLISLTNNFGRDMVIFTAVRDVLDLYSENLSRESSTDKSLGVFLQEITQVNPKAIIKCLPLICEFLEAESFGVRNSVLTICSELLIWSKANDSEIDLDLRADLVKTLLAHLLDGNAHVRSKVIQLLTRLIKERHLYNFEALGALEQLQKRVFDKTPTVRKHAIGLYSEIVKIDPALAKFTPAAWEKNARNCRERLIHCLVRDLGSQELELKVAIGEFLREVEAGYQVRSIPMQQSEEALAKITELLTAKKYWEACEYMYNAMNKFKEDEIFQLTMILGPFETYNRFFKNLLQIQGQGQNEENDLEDFIESEAAKEQRYLVDFAELKCGMNQIIHELVPKMTRLLDSGQESDRNEVLSFYAQLVESQYEPDEGMLKGVLESVKHIDGKTMSSQIESFCAILFRGVVDNELGMLKRLVELANTADILQRGYISYVIRELVNVKKLQLTNSMQILLDGFRNVIPGWNEEHARGSVYVLGILGGMDKKLMESALDILIDEGFGPRGFNDIYLMKAVCEAIYMMCPKFDKTRSKDDQYEETKRYDADYHLFDKLHTVILDGLRPKNTLPEDGYVKVAEMAVHIIYGLCIEPNGIIIKLIKEIGNIIFKTSLEGGGENANERMEIESEGQNGEAAGAPDLQNGNGRDSEDENAVVAANSEGTEAIPASQPESIPETATTVRSRRKSNAAGFDDLQLSESILNRYMCLIRFLLGAHINFYDKMVTAELKRRKMIARSKSKKNKSSRKEPARPTPTPQSITSLRSGSASVRGSFAEVGAAPSGVTTPSFMNISGQSGSIQINSSTRNASASTTDAVSEMQEMLGSAAYDAEIDMLQNYIQKIHETGCFKMYKTHVLYLCRRINEFKYSKLKSAIICCLGKTMSISPKSMLDGERTFLDVWKDSETPEVKCELIRSSVLLNVRYPSHMEKINECLMQGLTDPETIVRMAALDAITYLTLKDLMKTRDQLADASVCLLDPCKEIQEMTKHFFFKCNEKANAIQNALPEILSRLIQRSDVDQVQLQDIMKHLLSYVKPEKRAGGSLVDKIATLFQKAHEVRFCQDLAFCLKQFTYTEKQFKCIIDHLPHYADKLGDDVVFDSFLAILENARKNCKPEYRVKLDDYEKEFLAARTSYENQQRIEDNVRVGRNKAPARRNSDSSSSGGEEVEENGNGGVVENGNGNGNANGNDSEVLMPPPPAPVGIGIGSVRRRALPRPSPSPARGRQTSAARRQALSDSSSDDDNVDNAAAVSPRKSVLRSTPTATRGRGRGGHATTPSARAANIFSDSTSSSDDDDDAEAEKENMETSSVTRSTRRNGRKQPVNSTPATATRGNMTRRRPQPVISSSEDSGSSDDDFATISRVTKH